MNLRPLLALAVLTAPARAAEPPRPFYPPPAAPYQPQILPMPPPPRIEIPPPPPRGRPTPPPRVRRSPQGGTFLPGGMAITVTKWLSEDGGKTARSSASINRPRQAADELAACWSPPLPPKGETVEITIRFSFNGRGEVVGAPRTTYVKPAGQISREAVRDSLLAAIRDCAPLRFTRSMAASAPGYPLSVRFIGRRADDG
jgi:hypothetical protein